MTLLFNIQNPSQNPLLIESGRYPSGLWSTQYGQSGYTSQFCSNEQNYQKNEERPQLCILPHRNQSMVDSNSQFHL